MSILEPNKDPSMDILQFEEGNSSRSRGGTEVEPGTSGFDDSCLYQCYRSHVIPQNCCEWINGGRLSGLPRCWIKKLSKKPVILDRCVCTFLHPLWCVCVVDVEEDEGERRIRGWLVWEMLWCLVITSRWWSSPAVDNKGERNEHSCSVQTSISSTIIQDFMIW